MQVAPPQNDSMISVVDASALLALVFDEPGAEFVAEVVADGAMVSAVNLAEVATVLIRNQLDPTSLLGAVCSQVDVEPFTYVDALVVGELYPNVSGMGLSLGDRACLALARRLKAPAVTAEQIWLNLTLDIEIRLISEPH